MNAIKKADMRVQAKPRKKHPVLIGVIEIALLEHLRIEKSGSIDYDDFVSRMAREGFGKAATMRAMNRAERSGAVRFMAETRYGEGYPIVVISIVLKKRVPC